MTFESDFEQREDAEGCDNSSQNDEGTYDPQDDFVPDSEEDGL